MASKRQYESGASKRKTKEKQEEVCGGYVVEICGINTPCLRREPFNLCYWGVNIKLLISPCCIFFSSSLFFGGAPHGLLCSSSSCLFIKHFSLCHKWCAILSFFLVTKEIIHAYIWTTITLLSREISAHKWNGPHISNQTKIKFWATDTSVLHRLNK